MGLIENMFGALSGGAGALRPELGPAMHGLIGDAGSPGLTLPELVARLEGIGLRDTVRTWRGSGPYQALAPEDLHRALGEADLQQMATRAGLTPAELIGELSTHLPGVIANMEAAGHLTR